VSLDLDQWASLDRSWQNGDLNGNNSLYPEGGVVPFRLAIENLPIGAHTININYDFTAGGHKAYDFLATWNATNQPAICSKSGGAISSMCPGLPTASSFPFPSDRYVANSLTVLGAQAYRTVGRRLTVWGATVSSIAGPVHSGSVDRNSTANFVVTFRNTRSAVLFAWGGHLAQSAYWDTIIGGPLDGAGEVSGAPWHMRTLQLDGAGNRNQDRSIQPSAIVGALPPTIPATAPPYLTPPAPGATPSTYSGVIPPAPNTAVAAEDRPRPSGISSIQLFGLCLLATACALGVLARLARRRSARA
jgi:hypothetical protein